MDLEMPIGTTDPGLLSHYMSARMDYITLSAAYLKQNLDRHTWFPTHGRTDPSICWVPPLEPFGLPVF